MIIEGNLVDIHSNSIYPAKVKIRQGVIVSIEKTHQIFTSYILPGLIDAHVHIESSMTIPTRFSKMVVPRGTVGVVSDPHEIANVLGREGVEYMIEDGKNTPLKCFFGVPSCVPATSFESSGGRIEADDIEYLFSKGASFLAEMMNFPGVIYGDAGVKAKLDIAKKYNKPIDGHAPGIMGEDLIKYASAGISTDHECSTLQEALDKINLGMKVQIREGSAARNFESLHSLIRTHPDNVMLCTDDSHPDLITKSGHIDRLVRLALSKGYSIFEVYKAAVLNPVKHYNLPVGLLKEGDAADLIVVDNLSDFNILETYIDGNKVAEKGNALFDLKPFDVVNRFNCNKISEKDIVLNIPNGASKVKVIHAEDGELLTDEIIWKFKQTEKDVLNPDVSNDILKIVVVNRYHPEKPAVGFIKGFGLKKGAIASSVAHDSHNIVAIGCDDQSIISVINSIIEMKGGLVTSDGKESKILPLPVAGLMSDLEGEEVAKIYTELNEFVFNLGVSLKSPFMTLAFMSLLVIPKLKIGDKGLFDVSTFSFTNLFV
ncbi:adenine deaminase [Carboxylicivirga linearis]|uniref:Adenine deaminase n=1 Tax=Carboxylicivirga linearis TaxID=1628157 RepID=A0ABS5JVC9_9BACT|nr:adenine deaminase [Carboxylicivirga linearis]MBS2098842.1 adenine deaminase [Carboxylicivirga linearis]